MAGIDKESISALKEAKSGKEVYFALVVKNAAVGTMVVSKTSKVQQKTIDEAKKDCGGTQTVVGRCSAANGTLVVQTVKAVDANGASLTKKLVKEAGFSKCEFTTNPDAENDKPTTGSAPSGTAPAAPPKAAAFAPGQAPTRTPAKPGMLGAQRGAAPTGTQPSPATTAPAKTAGFAPGQTPDRAPAKPGVVMGAQRGAPPKAESSSSGAPDKEQWQQSLKSVEAPLAQSLKENKGDVGKMRALFQNARKKADGGNFDAAMDDLAQLRALLGSSGSSAPVSKDSLSGSSKDGSSYIDSPLGSSQGPTYGKSPLGGSSKDEHESGEQESNEDAPLYVDKASEESESNEGGSEEDASEYVSGLSGLGGGNTDDEFTEPETDESRAKAARLIEAGDRRAAKLDRATQGAIAAKAAKEAASQSPEAIAERAKNAENSAKFAEVVGTQSADPIDNDELDASSSEEDESNEDESNEDQAAQKPAARAPNSLKEFDTFVEQINASLQQFKTARESHEKFYEAMRKLSNDSIAETTALHEMIFARITGVDPSTVDPATKEILDFLFMLTTAAQEPEKYVQVAAALKLPDNSAKSFKAQEQDKETAARVLDQAKNEAKQTRQAARRAKQSADAAWKEFETIAEKKNELKPLRDAEAAHKQAEDIAIKASEDIHESSLAWNEARMNWDHAGEVFNEAQALVKKLAATSANPNQQEESRTKAAAAKQALDEARAASDRAAKVFSDKNVVLKTANEALDKAFSAKTLAQVRTEGLPSAKSAMKAREVAARAEFAATEAEQKYNQLAFARALESTGKNGPVEANPFLTKDDRKKLDAYFNKLKDVPKLNAQVEQSAADVKKVAAKMQAVKVDTKSLIGDIALQQYARNFASFGRMLANFIENKHPLDRLEDEMGFDPFDLTTINQARAALAKKG